MAIVMITMPHSLPDLQGVVVEASGMADRLEEVLFSVNASM